jgi:formate dehydrogenase major subunit
MLRKKTGEVAFGPRLSSALTDLTGGAIDRRTFLRRSGLAVGGLAAAASLAPGMVQKAEAANVSGAVEIKKSVCTHCSVGCTVLAKVDNGVWVGQEPGWDSPFNLGAHCAKGAAVREHAHGERRLKYPMKKVGGEWKRISWADAINEIGDKMLQIRDESGPDSVYWLGSAKHNNEQAYLLRKFAAYWGTNNIDHQARICHSTTVAGVANTWGYGAMTNSYNDIHKSRAIFIIGGNPAEAHPVSLLHVLKAKEQNNAPLIVCDPRFTRTAAHADEYVRFRPGTDVALIWGILWHIFENGWEDKEFIRTRVWGMDQIKEEVAKWNPDEVERVTGTPGAAQARRAHAGQQPPRHRDLVHGRHPAHQRQQQHPRLLRPAAGARQHGRPAAAPTSSAATTTCRARPTSACSPTPCRAITASPPAPGRTGPASGKRTSTGSRAVRHHEEGRRQGPPMMNEKGIPVSRWIDGVLEAKENLDQPDNTGMVLWGHAPNSQTRLPGDEEAMEKLDLLVVIDPFPTVSAVLHDRKDGVYLLPASTQFETYGSVTASNRSLQWREKVIEPLFESLPTTRSSSCSRTSSAGPTASSATSRWSGRRAEHRGHHPRVQPRHVDHRLHRPVAGAPEAAHGQPAHLRQDHAEGRGRPGRRRLLRPALALLGHGGDEPPRLAEPLRHVQAGGRRRPHGLPRPLRRGAGRRQPAGRGVSILSARRSRTAIPSSPCRC